MLWVADRAERLDVFLARMMPQHSRTKLARLVRSGDVAVQGQSPKPSLMLEAGWEVAVRAEPQPEIHDLAPAPMPLSVVYEDDWLLVVDKPRGLAVHPAASLKSPSLVNVLLARSHGLSSTAGSYRPGIVHRLDKETTGLMVVAKTDAAHVNLAKQIESKTAERRYVAVVAGTMPNERAVVDAPLGRDPSHRIRMAVVHDGKRAVTHFKRVATLGRCDLIAARLETGRTHQIRAHLRAIGHPVLGDRLYAPREWQEGPLQLHAVYLAFQHPVTGQPTSFYADPPDDFQGQDLVSRGSVDPF